MTIMIMLMMLLLSVVAAFFGDGHDGEIDLDDDYGRCHHDRSKRSRSNLWTESIR
jgi:hypothetical protein